MLIAALALLLAAPVAFADVGADLDRDGIADTLEQAILEQFRPEFLVSSTDCDGLPAEFQPGSPEPRVMARNGTIYGQVFPLEIAGIDGAVLEIHYYHLWGRDCRPMAHDLDVEHVSALVRATSLRVPVPEWQALYWYAGAHEGTVCDASHGARAASLGAERQGAVVWVSEGKHASFLTPELCKWGCGGDTCTNPKALAPGRLINLGERSAPLGGVQWIESKQWTLASKMTSDFSQAALARFDKTGEDEVVRLDGSLLPVKALVLAAGSAADGMGTGNRHTEAALGKARAHTGGALKRARRSVAEFLGISRK